MVSSIVDAAHSPSGAQGKATGATLTLPGVSLPTNEFLLFSNRFRKNSHMKQQRPQNADNSVPVEAVSFLPWPIYQRFGNGAFHSYSVSGNFDLHGILRKHSGIVVRSELRAERGEALLIGFSPDIWCIVSERNLTVYTSDAVCSEVFANDIKRHFEIREVHPSFSVIRNSYDMLHTEEVRFPAGREMPDDVLELHYGKGFTLWMETWISGLLQRDQDSGFSGVNLEPGRQRSFVRLSTGQRKHTAAISFQLLWPHN
jgi:hypothetical protein